MKEVLIATDISADAEHEISTWACCIEHNGTVIKKVGRFKQFTKNTAAAETQALINALVIARNEVQDWGDSKVTIYSEVSHVLRPITTKSGNIKKRDEHRAKAIREIAIPILQEALEYERVNVKAHYRYWYRVQDNKKYILNRWCDQESRAELRRIRNETKKVLALI